MITSEASKLKQFFCDLYPFEELGFHFDHLNTLRLYLHNQRKHPCSLSFSQGDFLEVARCLINGSIPPAKGCSFLLVTNCYKASVKDVGHTVCSWKLRPPTKWRRSFFSLGGAPLVGKSAVRPLFGSVVPSSALGETWRAPSQARNVLMARENPRERRRARGGVKQVLSLFQGKGGSPKGHHRRERSKRSSLSNQRLLIVTWTPRPDRTVQHRACDSPNLSGQHPHPSLSLQRFRMIRPLLGPFQSRFSRTLRRLIERSRGLSDELITSWGLVSNSYWYKEEHGFQGVRLTRRNGP